MKMELVKRAKKLSHEDTANFVSFMAKLSGNDDPAEGETIKLHFSNFNGETYTDIMSYLDNLTAEEESLKRPKIAEPAFTYQEAPLALPQMAEVIQQPMY